MIIQHISNKLTLDHKLNGVPLQRLATEEFGWREGWEYLLDEKMR
jgi:hypothetical protein